MAHWSGIGIPKTNAIALEVSYTHTHTHAMIVKTSAPTFAPPPRQQQQQQKQQQREGDGSCQTEGQTCSDDDDCCSNYCRGFSHVEYTLCAGPLPTRLPMPTTFQAETQQRHSFQKQDAATGTRRNEYPWDNSNGIDQPILLFSSVQPGQCGMSAGIKVSTSW